jgi:hypothetical protein
MFAPKREFPKKKVVTRGALVRQMGVGSLTSGGSTNGGNRAGAVSKQSVTIPRGALVRQVDLNASLRPAKRNMIASKTPVANQVAWSKFSIGKKQKMNKYMRDTDRDSVPDRYDCRPKNRRRQESFLPEDVAYLNSNPDIQPEKKLGDGMTGSVYSIKGNKNMVLKAPTGFYPNGDTNARRKIDVQCCADGIRREADIYNELNLEGETFCTPSKTVRLGLMKIKGKEVLDEEFIGLVRPKVDVIDYESTGKRPTDAQIEQIRQKLIALSNRGIMLMDGVQAGVDRAGRLLQFDLDYIEKTNNIDVAFKNNNDSWYIFLGDLNLNTPSGVRKYGEVSRTSSGNRRR